MKFEPSSTYIFNYEIYIKVEYYNQPLFNTSEITRMTLYENRAEQTEKYRDIGCLKNEFIFHLGKVSNQYFGKFDKELETIGAIAMK